jgi:hypothetical protein
MSSEIFSSYIIYRRQLAIKLYLNTLFGFVMIIISLYIFKSNFISFLFALLIIAPILFIKFIFAKFKKKIIVKLEENLFSTSIENKNEDEVYEQYYLNEIQAYNVQFPTRRFSSIAINLKNGKSIEFSFFTEKQGNEQNSGEEIINSIHLLIKKYNLSLSSAEKINFRRSFFASASGLTCIIAVSFLLLIAIILHIIIQVKTLPISLFFGIAILTQLVLKRKSDLEYFNKMK